MENKIMTAILVIIALIGLISIGYLIVKIVVLMKAHEFAKKMSASHPDFNIEIEKDRCSDEITLDESTEFLGYAMEGRSSFARLQFSKIAGEPSARIELLDKKTIVLGRGPDVDISIEDHTISKRHLELLLIDNKLQIQDLGTTNGTILDGLRLTSMSLVPVKNGSIVTIGRTCFSIHIV